MRLHRLAEDQIFACLNIASGGALLMGGEGPCAIELLLKALNEPLVHEDWTLNEALSWSSSGVGTGPGGPRLASEGRHEHCEVLGTGAVPAHRAWVHV